METPLAIALVLAAWLAELQDSALVLPLLAVAACTRLELLPLLFCVLVYQAVRRKHLGAAVVSLGMVAAAAAWTYRQFGVFAPNSMRAKQITYAYTKLMALHQFVEPRRQSELPWLVVAAGYGGGLLAAGHGDAAVAGAGRAV